MSLSSSPMVGIFPTSCDVVPCSEPNCSYGLDRHHLDLNPDICARENPNRLPSELGSELNNTTGRSCPDHAERRVGYFRIGECKLGPVQNVESFQSQLESQTLSKVRGLKERCVQIIHPLSAEEVSWRGPVHSESRLGECSGVEPLRCGPLKAVGIGIAHEVRSLPVCMVIVVQV